MQHTRHEAPLSVKRLLIALIKKKDRDVGEAVEEALEKGEKVKE